MILGYRQTDTDFWEGILHYAEYFEMKIVEV
jgi:hypothetical protein